MAKKAEETAAETSKTEKVKSSLSYAQRLEARAQRGEMTHQKKLAVKQAKQKETKGV